MLAGPGGPASSGRRKPLLAGGGGVDQLSSLGSCNLLATMEYIAAMLYLTLFLLALIDTGATLNNSGSNSITSSITALVMLCIVTCFLAYCAIWLMYFSQHVGALSKGHDAPLLPSHFRPMRIHLFCFCVFMIVLEILTVLFYYQVSGNQSGFQDRYVGDSLTTTLDVRVYIAWQSVKVFIFSFAPLEALLVTWCIIQHRNPQRDAMGSVDDKDVV
jgi:uncharacterized membrane protein